MDRESLAHAERSGMFPHPHYPQGGSLVGEKDVEAAHYDTAAIISLHYLVLALRKKENGRAVLREHYISQALMWRREAINLLTQATSAHV